MPSQKLTEYRKQLYRSLIEYMRSKDFTEYYCIKIAARVVHEIDRVYDECPTKVTKNGKSRPKDKISLVGYK